MVRVGNKFFVFGGNKDPNMYCLLLDDIMTEPIGDEAGLRDFYDPEIIAMPKDEADISS